jgi:hypothetical protein
LVVSATAGQQIDTAGGCKTGFLVLLEGRAAKPFSPTSLY